MDSFQLCLNDEIHGKNLVINPTNTIALRSKEHSANGIVFTNRPILPNELCLIEILITDNSWCGHLRVGIVSKNIYETENFQLTETSIPEMVEKYPESCHIVAITKSHNQANQKIRQSQDDEILNPRSSSREEHNEDKDDKDGNDTNFYSKEYQNYDKLEILPGYTTTGLNNYLGIADWQKPSWNTVSYDGDRLKQMWIENKMLEFDRQTNLTKHPINKADSLAKMNFDVGSRIGLILRPIISDDPLLADISPKFANLHTIINGRDQGVVKNKIPINDLKNPNYVMIDCYAQTRAIRIIRVPNRVPPLSLLARDEIIKNIPGHELEEICDSVPVKLGDFLKSGLIL